jgi:hypothetical protein
LLKRVCDLPFWVFSVDLDYHTQFLEHNFICIGRYYKRFDTVSACWGLGSRLEQLDRVVDKVGAQEGIACATTNGIDLDGV